jgi:hypothetical protein
VAGLDFPGVYQAFRIQRLTFDLVGNPLRHPETVHGITSLTGWQANPADLLTGNRGHWEVENREHYATERSTRTAPRSALGPRPNSRPPPATS